MATGRNIEHRDSDSGSNSDNSESDGQFSGFDSDNALFKARILGQFWINQAGNDRIIPIDTQFCLETDDSPPLNAPFSGVPGLTVALPDNPKPLSFFYLIENLFT